MINQTDLEYFIELTKTQHLTRASERLGITQPALSHCLKRMETEVGSTLFIRSKKGLQLTAAGRKLQNSVTELLLKWEEVKVSVRSEVEDASGIIRLGCHTAVSQYTLPEFLGDLLKKHPGIELQLTHGLSRHMTEMVISNQLDVAIAVNPVRHLDLIIKEICRDEVTLWYSKSIKNKDVLLIEPSLLQTQDVLKKLKKNGIQFQRVIESSSLEVIANLVAKGVGYGILPERVLNSIGATDCEKVKQAPHFTDKICLVYKNEFRQLKRGEIFIQMLCR